MVSGQWLAEHSADPNVVIVDCRFDLMQPHLGQQQYQAGHIPGAYYLDLNHDLASPVAEHGGRHPLPDPDSLALKLARMGINPETLVVSYDDSRFAFAARLWWLLRYLGHEHAAVLDGGFNAYQAAGYPVTSEIPAPKLGRFTPQLQTQQVVDIQALKARKHQLGVVVVDSRTPERYLGEHEPIDPVAGHIPGAVNYPWQQVTDDRGRLLSLAALRSHWSDLTGASEILVYCGSGVTACVNLLALEAAGLCTGKLYAGSWSDWCSYLLDGQMEAQV
jgi:thiosulfate/3-mercaptopyruvate sulfurtransferase